MNRTISKIEKYNRNCVIGFHGSIIKDNFKNYYSSHSRNVLSFNKKIEKDMNVHILGTGTIGFHTSTIKVKFEYFKTPNMADIYFGIKGQEQKIPFIVQEHFYNEMYSIEDEKSISKSGIKKDDTKFNTSSLQNKLIKSLKWNNDFTYIKKN